MHKSLVPMNSHCIEVLEVKRKKRALGSSFPHTEYQIGHSGEKPQGSKNDRNFIEIFILIQYE